MSNTLAIATVTATLQHLIQMYITTDLSAAIVKIGQPSGPPAGDPVPAINISLYQVTPNLAYRNADLPARDSRGRLFTKPRLGLDLHYLVSFYGDDQKLEPQRLLGRVAQILHGQPILTRELITQAMGAMNEIYPFLANSDLDQELIEQIKFTPQAITFEELSRLWSTFFQTIPYTLSMVYMASVVLIDGIEDNLKVIKKVKEDPKITVAKRLPNNKARSITFEIDENERAGQITGTVKIEPAVDESYVAQYVLYWSANGIDKIPGTGPVINPIPKTGSQLTCQISDVLLPPTATHLLVVIQNQYWVDVLNQYKYVEMEQGISVKINDVTPKKPITKALGISFTNGSVDVDKLSGTATITAANPETGITHYGLYWGINSTTKLPGSFMIDEIPVAGHSDYNHEFNNVLLPNEATHLLVFTRNYGAEMDEGESAVITPARPTIAAAGISFNGNINAGQLTGTATITAANPETGITHYGLYWGMNSTTKLPGVSIIEEINAVADANYEHIFTNVEIPNGATHLLVFTKNNGAEMVTGVSTSFSN